MVVRSGESARSGFYLLETTAMIAAKMILKTAVCDAPASKLDNPEVAP